MPITLGDLATRIGGMLSGGDPSFGIAAAATLETATPHDITLVDSPERLHLLARSRAAAAIVPAGSGPLDRPSIEVADVHAAFTATILLFRPPRQLARAGISPQAGVDPSARLSGNVDVHPFATIGADVEIGPGATIHSGAHVMAGCRIGANTTIFPNAVLYENTIVGERCLIHAAAVLGGYGFGYKAGASGYALSAQLGWVELADDVDRSEVKTKVEAALSGAVDVLWLTDKKGRDIGVAASKIAYIELGTTDSERRIGFGG